MTVGRFKFVLWVPEPAGDLPIDLMFRQLKEMQEKYDWSYYHVALEECPRTGKEHLDGYYEYPTQRRWKTENNKWLKKFGKGYGDLQVAYGTAGENMDYSQKEGGRFETYGIPAAGQGFRADLKEIKDDIVAGKRTVEQACLEDPMVFHQYGRTLQKIEDIALRKKHRTWMTECDWLYGPTGVGKSHHAFNGFQPDTHYVWKNDNGWQDGYTGQETVIINDFRGEIKYNEFLQMIDRWPYYIPRRGREPAPFLAKLVIVTSSLPPSMVYMDRQGDMNMEQFNRRVTVIHVEDCDTHTVENRAENSSFEVAPEG